MDRNSYFYIIKITETAVALRKESVDRNVDPDSDNLTDDVSLSARRAWIEIFCQRYPFGYFGVALRKESVDRNTDPINLSDIPPKSLSARRAWIEIFVPFDVIRPAMSLSARRAWIEIPTRSTFQTSLPVALRKESVDRNIIRVCYYT